MRGEQQVLAEDEFAIVPVVDDGMDVYRAHLDADRLQEALRVAHAYRGCGAEAQWECHAISAAIEAFDKLAALMTAVRERLVALNTVTDSAHEEEPF